MEKSQNLAPSGPHGSKAKICKVCGKEGAGIAIRDHIEANHLEGVALPCNVCGKEFRSRMILRKHTCNRKWNDFVNMGHQVFVVVDIWALRSRSQLRKHNCICWAPFLIKGQNTRIFFIILYSRARVSLRQHRASQHKRLVWLQSINCPERQNKNIQRRGYVGVLTEL